MDQLADGGSKKLWTNKEIVGFLRAYIARKEDFKDIENINKAMTKVLNELFIQNIVPPTTTVGCLTDKLAKLLKAYRTVKDFNNRIGVSEISVPYHSYLEQIIDTWPGPLPVVSNKANTEIDEMKKLNKRRKLKLWRKLWTKQETDAFIKGYIAKLSEFSQYRKQEVLHLLLLDLISKGEMDPNTTVTCLQIKLKNMTRAYKNALRKKNLLPPEARDTYVIENGEEMELIMQTFAQRPTLTSLEYEEAKPLTITEMLRHMKQRVINQYEEARLSREKRQIEKLGLIQKLIDIHNSKLQKNKKVNNKLE